MAKKFNLLPEKPTESKFIKNSIQNAKKSAIVLSVLLIAALGTGFSVLYLINSNLTSLQDENQQLKQNIRSLEGTEQSLILLKDRLSKIQTIVDGRQAFDSFEVQRKVVQDLPEGIIYDGSDISSGESILGVKTSKSRLLSDIVRSLENNDSLKIYKINNISFNNQQGFVVEFEIR